MNRTVQQVTEGAYSWSRIYARFLHAGKGNVSDGDDHKKRAQSLVNLQQLDVELER